LETSEKNTNGTAEDPIITIRASLDKLIAKLFEGMFTGKKYEIVMFVSEKKEPKTNPYQTTLNSFTK